MEFNFKNKLTNGIIHKQMVKYDKTYNENKISFRLVRLKLNFLNLLEQNNDLHEQNT